MGNYTNRLFRGRVNRKTYIIGNILLLVPFLITCFIFLILYGVYVVSASHTASAQSSIFPILMVVIFFLVIGIPYGIYFSSLFLRRLQDNSKSYLFVTAGELIPGWSMLELFYLFSKGQDKANMYGMPSQASSLQEIMKEVFNPIYPERNVPVEGGYPINIITNIIPTFASLKIENNKVIIRDIEKTQTISFDDIIDVSVSEIANIRPITLIYKNGNMQHKVLFAWGDYPGDNVSQTMRLYATLAALKYTSQFGDKLLHPSFSQKYPPVLFIGMGIAIIWVFVSYLFLNFGLLLSMQSAILVFAAVIIIYYMKRMLIVLKGRKQ